MNENQTPTRRDFLKFGAAAWAGVTMGGVRLAGAEAKPVEIAARPARLKLHPQLDATELWTYDGRAPGTPLRAKQGEVLRIRVKNHLPQATSVHWHGLRVPNAMDGVPYLTQEPLAPGASQEYSFRVPDAGTFFYHPHINSTEQMARGLFGALIVDEADPPAVDRDVTWVLNDWRVRQDGRLYGQFDNPHDMSHAGRYGNLVTVSGRWDPQLSAARHARVRLRLINAATARVFSLGFGALNPWVIALDGQPVAPRPARADDLLIGPGMRVDLIVDMPNKAGLSVPVVDSYDGNTSFRVGRIVVSNERPARPKALGKPAALAPNPVPQVDVARAKKLGLLFAGGAIGGMAGRGGQMMRRHMHHMMRRRLYWIVNDRLIPPLDGRQSAAPLFRMTRGGHYILSMENQTVFDHPIHLHGHTFQVLSRNGKPVAGRELRDTVLMRPRERVDIGFVADNPGRWMLHCHVLGHARAGMGGVVEVL